MDTNCNGEADNVVQQFKEALEGYRKQHPQAVIDAYRSNTACVRVRIIDNDFLKMGRLERDEVAWPFLESLPEDALSELSMLVLITPAERTKSMANIIFEERTGSMASSDPLQSGAI